MKFSILVVCLNPGDKLKNTLKSALIQDYKDYEIIIKDGGSKDGSVEEIPTIFPDAPITIYNTPDKGIYDAMNQAVGYATGDYVFFLNCGDRFHDEKVLSTIAKKAKEIADKGKTDKRMIFYGNIFGEKNQVWITPSPKINGFTCYRNVPCHQACFYDTGLCKEKPFEQKYKIRGDYEQFLWCFYRGNADFLYVDMPVADYEGGGYSETKENLKRSDREHKEITKIYMSSGELFKYRMILLLTLAPLRKAMAESKTFSGIYNKLRSTIYGKTK